MSIVYTWSISQLDTAPLENNLENVVKVIHWRYHANDGTNATDIYGSVNLDPPDPLSYVPYASLTEVEVISWLENKLNSELEEMKVSLNHKLENITNPMTINSNLPWL